MYIVHASSQKQRASTTSNLKLIKLLLQRPLSLNKPDLYVKPSTTKDLFSW